MQTARDALIGERGALQAARASSRDAVLVWIRRPPGLASKLWVKLLLPEAAPACHSGCDPAVPSPATSPRLSHARSPPSQIRSRCARPPFPHSLRPSAPPSFEPGGSVPRVSLPDPQQAAPHPQEGVLRLDCARNF
ncbi:hypothetical protein T484DRAFT_1984414 [Baffinella frigidus]|nr:hypothetical protein T484DRAFT_1984414 [Cryptophyta sp. CCMP2293]